MLGGDAGCLRPPGASLGLPVLMRAHLLLQACTLLRAHIAHAVGPPALEAARLVEASAFAMRRHGRSSESSRAVAEAGGSAVYAPRSEG